MDNICLALNPAKFLNIYPTAAFREPPWFQKLMTLMKIHHNAI